MAWVLFHGSFTRRAERERPVCRLAQGFSGKIAGCGEKWGFNLLPRVKLLCGAVSGLWGCNTVTAAVSVQAAKCIPVCVLLTTSLQKAGLSCNGP